ncbi:MAG: hypothetical protein ACJ764_00620 [Solirubrobacteraceae bacterium]
MAVAIKLHNDSVAAAKHRQAAVAAARARTLREQRLHQQQAQQREQKAERQVEVTMRKSLESQLDAAITKDATHNADTGLLTSGPAQSTTCTPVSGGSSQNLSQSTGTYSCIAVYQTNSDGTQSGYRYGGTINFNSGEMTWQLGGGVGG